MTRRQAFALYCLAAVAGIAVGLVIGGEFWGW